MSLAKVQHVAKARKDQGQCGKCGKPLPAGSPYIHYAVGFRGFKRVRCTDTACYPPPSERESSAVAAVYAAQEDVDVTGAETLDDLYAIRDDVAAACAEVADEYESNEMYEINADLQERAEQVRAAGDELEGWEPQEEEPQEDDPDTWDVNGEAYDDFASAHAEWLDVARDELLSAINDMELP